MDQFLSTNLVPFTIKSFLLSPQDKSSQPLANPDLEVLWISGKGKCTKWLRTTPSQYHLNESPILEAHKVYLLTLSASGAVHSFTKRIGER